jgi:ribosomal silencing factor RsfS
MSEAHYSVIRYIPDPARGERLNIGILLWEEQSADFRLSLDEKAIERVIRENPRLELNSLLYVEPMLREQLASAVTPVTARIKTMLDKQGGFPLELADPLFTAVPSADELEEDEDGLDATLDRLVKRIVHPKRRGGAGHPSPKDQLATRLRPLINNQAVSRAYQVKAKSGVPRHVDFFANSGANVALDVVQLAISKADEIRQRADAEAMKVIDLLGGSDVNDYLVYCQFSDDRQLADVYGEARTVIEAQGARVLDDPDEAAEALQDAAGSR